MNITNAEMTQATIEIFGGFICLMLAVIIMMNGNERDSWKWLKRMLFSTAGIFFAETCAYIFRGNTDGLSIVMTRISNFIVFFLNIILIYLFMNYMYSLLREKGVVPGNVYRNVVNVCVAIVTVILFANVFIKWMYYFDKDNYYHRNTMWYVYTALNLICILTSSIMCIRYRKSVRKTMLASLLIYSLAPVITIILQTFIYGVSIANFGIFVALLFMLMTYLKEWRGTKERKEKERKVLDIILLFIIMTISMSASIISCIVSIQRISEKNSESNSMIIAHMISDGVEKEFLKPITVAETMSNDFNLKEYMKKGDEESPELVEKEVASYLDSIRTGLDYQMVFTVCGKSKAYFTYDGISRYVDTENGVKDIWYKEFLEKGEPYELNVDNDKDNNWELSVFVNYRINDEDGNYIGVCGAGVEMTHLQDIIKRYEDNFHVKIDLVDKNGLIQVDSDINRIEEDYIDADYFENVGSEDFYYEDGSHSSRMTKYMEDLNWYLVVEDLSPDKINVVEITTSSIIIFIIGLVMMGIVFFVISMRESKASKELAEKRKTSITDDLTGLFNRRGFEEDCEKILEENSVSGTTIIMMDVNGLKVVNDTYGHMAGDELLMGAAKCISTSMGKYGTIYRTGGDEFVALLQCSKSQLKDMLQTFEHITESWKGTYQSELSISKGIVVCKEHEDMTFEEMKKMADKLMYESKDEYYERTGKERRKI